MSDTFKAIVLGDTCDDEYVYGTVDRLSPENPVPVLKYTQVRRPKEWQRVNNNLRSFGIGYRSINSPKKISSRLVSSMRIVVTN